MNADSWGRLKSLFNEAVAIDAQVRDAFLDSRCGEDAELRRELHAMLAVHDEIADSDDRRISALNVSETRTNAGVPLQGTTRFQLSDPRIGPYVLAEQIGEGGFGVVFRAEQERPVRRSVALKIIKLGMDTRQVIARFEAEQQALAMMNHPSIARVFDAGATAEGRPYFVMELVDGVPITEYCDARGLGLRERLRLFVAVCEAVQHAHQKGVIHRDLKPRNVLVGDVDGRPHPKVIDFGIAKATQQRLTHESLTLDAGQLIGTPQYMSPEQAAGDADIDTRTDIYSLGVVLYELLTTTTPFEIQQLRAAPYHELQRIMREVDPPTPSMRISSLASGPAVSRDSDSSAVGFAGRGQAGRPQLVRAVRGELDWVVMKALEKDRERRYESASALAADLMRVLRDEPVAAGPPSHTYRLRKWIRRHRAAFAAVLAVGATLLLGVAGTSIGMLRARGAEHLARHTAEQARQSERDAVESAQRAETARQRSTEVARLLKEMLRGVDPAVARGRDTTALRQILDRTSARLSSELTGQPELEAELREMIGDVYGAMAQFDDAELSYAEARRLLAEVYGSASREVAAIVLKCAAVLHGSSRIDDALALSAEAMRIVDQLDGDTHQLRAEALATQAGIDYSRDRLDDAARSFTEALAILRADTEPNNSRIAGLLTDIATVRCDQGQIVDSEKLLREALDLEASLGEEDFAVSTDTRGRMVIVLSMLHRTDEAEAMAREVLDIRRRYLTDNHTETAAAAMEVANLLYARGQFVEAESLFREAAATLRRLLGNDASELGTALNALSGSLFNQERLDEAEDAIRDAIGILERSQTASPDQSLSWYGRLAQILTWKGNYAGAEQALRRCIDIVGRSSGEESFAYVLVLNAIGETLSHMAAAHRAAGNYAAAWEAAEESVAVARRALAAFDRMEGVGERMLYGVGISMAEPLIQLAEIASHVEQPAISFEERIAHLREAEDLLLRGHKLAVESGSKTAAQQRQRALSGLIFLYVTWDTLEPGAGHDVEAKMWRQALTEFQLGRNAVGDPQAGEVRN